MYPAPVPALNTSPSRSALGEPLVGQLRCAPPVPEMRGGVAGDEAERLLTVQDVASLLRVHPKTIYSWVGSGRVPCVHVGTRLRFDRRDVLLWVSARKEG